MARYYGLPDVRDEPPVVEEQVPTPQAETEADRARRRMLERVIWDERRWQPTLWE
jgi:hypothetical protein